MKGSQRAVEGEVDQRHCIVTLGSNTVWTYDVNKLSDFEKKISEVDLILTFGKYIAAAYRESLIILLTKRLTATYFSYYIFDTTCKVSL